MLTVNPGYVNTNLSKNAFTGSGSLHGKVDDTTAGGYSSIYVAKQIINHLCMRASDVDMIDMKTRIALWLAFFAPSLLNKFMIKKIVKEVNNNKSQ